MKRWNKKGSVHANVRMAELRERKERLRQRDEIHAHAALWAQRTGHDFTDWFKVAKAQGALDYGCSQADIIKFLQS